MTDPGPVGGGSLASVTTTSQPDVREHLARASATRQRLATTPMPPHVQLLPRTREGYPIPFFAAVVDGEPDLRVARPEAYRDCIVRSLCWVCGLPRGGEMAFVIGPMCVVNRISADPPSHVACAVYAVGVCPFLAVPTMARRDRGMPDGVTMSGVPILRNPGVAVIYVTTSVEAFQPDPGRSPLFSLGDPLSVSWWSHSRPATRAEVVEAIESGLPILDAACDEDDDPAAARALLAEQRETAWNLLPRM